MPTTENQPPLNGSKMPIRAIADYDSQENFLCTPLGKWMLVCSQIHHPLGFSCEELNKKTVHQLLQPTDADIFLHNMNQISRNAGDSFCLQARLSSSDGSLVWVEIRVANMLHIYGVKAFVAYFRDISIQIKNQEELCQNQANFQVLINNSKDLMWSVDTDFKLITSNTALDKMMELMGEKPIQLGSNMLNYAFSSEQQKRFKHYYQRAFNGEMHTQIEYTDRPIEIWTEITYSPIKNGEEIVGAACHSHQITKNKLAERKLLKSEAGLNESQSIAKLGNWEIDLVNNTEIWSNGLYEIFGMPYSQKLTRAQFNAFIHPDDLNMVLKHVENSISTLCNSSLHFRFLRTDGQLRYGYSEYCFEKNDKNQLLRQYGVVQDVSEQKLIERQVKASEQMLKEAQAIAHLGNWKYDSKTNETIWSEEACRIYGFLPTETKHNFTEWLTYIHPDDRELVIEKTKEARRTFTDFSLIHRIILKDGTLKYIESKSKYECDEAGNAIGLFGIAHDITELVKAQELLKKSEAFNRGVLRSLRSHIAVVDEGGKIITVNEAWRKYSMQNGDFNLINTCEGINYFNVCEKSSKLGNKTAELALAGMKSVMGGHQPFFYLEYPCHSPNEKQWFAMRVMKFDGDEPMIVVAHENITNVKLAELALENTLLELEDRVEKRTHELSNKNKSFLDSINYAKRIQVGLLTQNSKLFQVFPQSFILAKPRDIVSGDFFWCFERQNKKFIILADCTGHGVPSALMSIIGTYLIQQIIVNENVDNPSEILQLLDFRLKEAITGDEEEIKDGMDIVLCVINESFLEVYFAGALLPVFVSDPSNNIIRIPPSREAIGGGLNEKGKHFITQRFPIQKGQFIYLSSDGYYSQFGGPKGKKYMKKHFIETLQVLQQHPIEHQKEILQTDLHQWQGHNEQVDDILVIGIKI
jgi:PAS domain S-box-containing protein